jgi:hypothetical protein
MTKEDGMPPPLKDDLLRQLLEPGLIYFRGIGKGVIEAQLSEFPIERIDVTTAAINHAVADSLIVVPLNANDIRLPEQFDGSVRIGPKASQVAETKSVAYSRCFR